MLQFTSQDVQNLIAVAQNAPLQNMKHAQAVSELLQRFSAWYDYVTSPAALGPATPPADEGAYEQEPRGGEA